MKKWREVTVVLPDGRRVTFRPEDMKQLTPEELKQFREDEAAGLHSPCRVERLERIH